MIAYHVRERIVSMSRGRTVAGTLQRLVLVVCAAFAFNAWATDAAAEDCAFKPTEYHIETKFENGAEGRPINFVAQKYRWFTSGWKWITYKNFTVDDGESEKICMDFFTNPEHRFYFKYGTRELPYWLALTKIECLNTKDGDVTHVDYNLDEGLAHIKSSSKVRKLNCTWYITENPRLRVYGSMPASFELVTADAPKTVVSIFDLGSYESKSLNLLPGSYTLRVTKMPERSVIDQIDCGAANLPKGETTFKLASAGTTCTFRFRSTGSLKITNSVIHPSGGPMDEKFTYTLTDPDDNDVPLNPSELGDGESTTAEVPAVEGSYTITQTPIEGWTLTVSGDGCTQEQEGSNTVKVAVTKDETTQCTFTNTARFDAVDTAMAEETLRFIYRRVDNLLSHGPDRSRRLRRLQTPGPRGSQGGPLKFSGTNLPNGSGPTSSRGSRPLSSAGSPNREIPLSATGGSDRSLSYSPAGELNQSGVMSLGAAPDREPPLSENAMPWQSTFPSSDQMRGDAFGMTATGPTSTSTALFSSLGSQLAPLLSSGSTSFKFGTSLSEVRAKAAEAEARAQQKKLEAAGLSLSGASGLAPLQVPRTGLDIWVE